MGRRHLALGALAASLGLSLGAGIILGSVRVPFGTAVRALLRGPEGVAPEAYAIVVELRAPRVLLAAAVGAALASSGVTYQALFRNDLADPYVIGVSAGAALGAVAALSLGAGGPSVPVAAFLCAIATVTMAFRIARRDGGIRMADLLLAGLALSALLTAATSLLLVLSSGTLQQALTWLLGGFGGRGWFHVAYALPYVAMGYVLVQVRWRELNLLLLSEDEAWSLGVDVVRARRWLVGGATLMSAAAVSVAGLIGFVGLVVPHLVRRLLGPDHRLVLPGSALAGAALMVDADLVARTVAPPMEIPVGVVTAFLGVPFFLWLLRQGGK
ncbi:MAG: iron ABC transporter permease [Armatimonadota bacterium]|nr:iron ABC transporter permease [Armatimonadota bacterium]MDR7445003.1 iron ABC transporter permease [Armatimonadota bacterium]MDR7570089.1 iron ABC transporter permease [Armatimonadota bacterium]MDR7614907.1 iron ABC transporter permease [Armatimonadota bacterium]